MSGMTLSEAAAELSKLGNLGRAIAKAQEVGAALVTLDGGISEKQALLAKLADDCSVAAANLATLKANGVEAEQRASDVLAKAKAEATRIGDEARIDANAVKGAAHEAQHAAEVEIRRLSELAAQRQNAIGDAQKALDDLNAKIAAAKEHARTLMGA